MPTKETIIYNGKKYHRYPESKRRHLRVYYWRHDKWKAAPVSLHRQIYADNYGEIPKGHHINHIDHNPLNNDVSNLECLTPKEHCQKDNNSMSESARAERNAKHKIAWSNRKNYYRCKECGNEFTTSKPAGAIFCSRICRERWWFKDPEWRARRNESQRRRYASKKTS